MPTIQELQKMKQDIAAMISKLQETATQLEAYVTASRGNIDLLQFLKSLIDVEIGKGPK